MSALDILNPGQTLADLIFVVGHQHLWGGRAAG